MDVPRKINLGSGKDFRADYLNIDINADWSPDIVTDVGLPMFEFDDPEFDTHRFGRVKLERGAFESIMSNDVLEHVLDLVMTMTNVLELLQVGGTFQAMVPYDLSYGAWQDPTHLRAFNERSWLYYTDWFWYLGWKTHRFTTRNLEFQASAEGEKMMLASQPQDVILRTPRAVDPMKITLEKIPLSDIDRQMVEAIDTRKEASRIRLRA